jgi:hypothetical protein
MTFNLKIRLGDDGMLDGADLAKALRTIANTLEPRTEASLPGCLSKVWDRNGNTVGHWSIKEGK